MHDGMMALTYFKVTSLGRNNSFIASVTIFLSASQVPALFYAYVHTAGRKANRDPALEVLLFVIEIAKAWSPLRNGIGKGRLPDGRRCQTPP